MSEKIKLRDGDTMLIMVMDGRVVPQHEFATRRVRAARDGPVAGGCVGWLGFKGGRKSGRHQLQAFFGYQLPGPDWVQTAVREKFE
jgi:hypothetical protein